MRHYFRLSSFVSLLLVVSSVFAQESPPDIQPAPLIRLTGVLKIVAEPPVSAFPALRVWFGDVPRVFRVVRVESVIPAYPAEERLQAVSTLGLRFIAEPPVLTALQSPEFHERLIVIEGWLRPKAGVLRVRSVEKVEERDKFSVVRVLLQVSSSLVEEGQDEGASHCRFRIAGCRMREIFQSPISNRQFAIVSPSP